nr:hypothetical protein [Paracoccus aminovorans]
MASEICPSASSPARIRSSNSLAAASVKVTARIRWGHPVALDTDRASDHVAIKPGLKIPSCLHPSAPTRGAAFLVIDHKQAAEGQFQDRVGLAMQADAMRLSAQPDLVTDDLRARSEAGPFFRKAGGSSRRRNRHARR